MAKTLYAIGNKSKNNSNLILVRENNIPDKSNRIFYHWMKATTVKEYIMVNLKMIPMFEGVFVSDDEARFFIEDIKTNTNIDQLEVVELVF